METETSDDEDHSIESDDSLDLGDDTSDDDADLLENAVQNRTNNEQLNFPIYEGSPTTIMTALVGLLTIVQRHGKGSDTVLAAILNYSQLILPQPNNFPKTKANLMKVGMIHLTLKLIKDFQIQSNKIDYCNACSRLYRVRDSSLISKTTKNTAPHAKPRDMMSRMARNTLKTTSYF